MVATALGQLPKLMSGWQVTYSFSPVDRLQVGPPRHLITIKPPPPVLGAVVVMEMHLVAGPDALAARLREAHTSYGRLLN